MVRCAQAPTHTFGRIPLDLSADHGTSWLRLRGAVPGAAAGYVVEVHGFSWQQLRHAYLIVGQVGVEERMNPESEASQ